MFSKKNLNLIFLFLSASFLAISLMRSFVYLPLQQKNLSYKQLWERVDSCEKQGLSESAMKAVLDIYDKAKTENNSSQFVKAVIYKMKLVQYKEEFAAEKNIQDLNKEVETSKFPVQPILQSLLADAYWSYYQNNRWKFQNRSSTVNFKKEDLSTYDIKDLVNVALRNYQNSLQDTVLLKQTKIEGFEEILLRGSGPTRVWRPSLYDLLAHRALDFYKNSEADVIKAANQFSLNDENFLKPYPDFLNCKFAPASDSLDFRYYCIRLFRDLTQFQLISHNTEGLADLELERLQYIFNNSQHPLKDSIYLQSIAHLSKTFEKSTRIAEILYLKAEWESTNASNYKPLTDSTYKWSKKRALAICDRIALNYPKSRGAQMALNLSNEIRSKILSIEVEKVNDPGLANRMLIKYSNVQQLHFKLVKTNVFDYTEMINKHYGKDLYKKLLSLPTIQTFVYNLPDDKDYNTHSTELNIKPTEPGFYILLAGTSEEFSQKEQISSHQVYVVSDLAYLAERKKTGENEVYVLSRQSGQPLKDVQAQAWYTEYNNKLRKVVYIKGNSYVSDQNGKISIEAQSQQYRNYQLEFTYKKDQLFSNDNFYSYRNERDAATGYSSFIFTDRAIYRPGQTVYFKSILLKGSRNKHEVLTKYPVTLSFYDVNQQKISSQDLVSNDYGTVSGSFTAPQGVLTGQMQITDGISSKFISVEEYKRPKFETVFDTLKGEYQLNDTVKVKGLAKAYAGNNIDGAQVKYRVVRNVNYPYWWYWYRPYFVASNAAEITNGTTITNDKGEYTISFVALPDQNSNKKDHPIFSYEIFADVTDINGETHSCSSIFKAGYQSLELSLDCSETINALDPPKMSINAVNLNGVKENVNGVLSIYQLETPKKIFRKRLWEQPDKPIYSEEAYYKLFPHDLYADELNQYKWKRSKKIVARNFNTKSDQSVLLNEFKNLSPGVYLVEGICKDKKGEEIKSINSITVYNPNSTELPYKMAQWEHVLKTTAEPGEKASFLLASSYTDVHCLFEQCDQEGNKISTITPSTKAIEIPINEAQRGGLILNTRFVKYGRIYTSTHYIQVPFTNKELDITYSSFRNKLLPGQQEEWTLNIKNKKGEKVAAEMLASMYDASLDAFAPNEWNFSIYQSLYSNSNWLHSLEDLSRANLLNGYHRDYYNPEVIRYDALNYFGLGFYSTYYDQVQISSEVRSRKFKRSAKSSEIESFNEAAPSAAGRDEEKMETAAFSAGHADGDGPAVAKKTSSTKSGDLITQVATRKNFNETAFFFPNLQTNENGDVIIKFTIPESLTRWKLMGFAHTKDLSFALTENQCVTQKELMVVPNAPRFLREGDEMSFIAKVSNLSDKELKGLAELKFYDAFTEKELTTLSNETNAVQKEFTLQKGLSNTIEWKIKIPEGLQAVKYKVVAKAGNFSDGEEMALPVLPNRMLVTESMPLPIRSFQTKEFSFSKFINQNNHSTTLKNHAYTLEFTANPAWYAVQSLPYLMEYPYECAEQTFSRYYANALATHIVNSKPKIKQIFEAWKISSPETFLSNLEKNQELKALLLQETPWLLQAKNESENKKRVALLFDLNKMSQELNLAITKLEKMQSANGAWPWFSGCPEDWYITQHILSGLGHLQKLGVDLPDKKEQIDRMISQGLRFCDNKLREIFEDMKKYNSNYRSENQLQYMAIHYLYMRSYFTQIEIPSRSKEAFNFYKKQAQSYWLNNNRYMQGMLALSLNRFGDKNTATSILRSLKENALNSEEMGMYWKENYGYYWYQAPIEMQALMIETFDEVTGDLKAVDDLKTWLIKSKQTQHWGTTKATTEAVYALLLRGTDWLATEPNVEIYLGDIKLDPKNDVSLKAEAGTGYFKKTYSGSEINPNMGKVKVIKKDEGVSYGALYWQYFEQLDKITPHETPLKLNKKLFLQKNTASGPVIEAITENTLVKIGDKVKVRIELRSDRDMEYVHLKDMRAACLEPINVISSYKYQDGLGYYESTADAATNFFISYLPKGIYVFEYPVVVSHAGNFSNGISNIQSMYAPEFTSHSEGVRIKVTR